MSILRKSQQTTQKDSSASRTEALTFAYRVDDGIYINLTNRCSNSCDFCLRNNSDGAYGSDSLWLAREPEPEEAAGAAEKLWFEGCREFVFCGYGEPTCRVSALEKTASLLKEKYSVPIRLNTNGQGSLINKRDIVPELCGKVDTVSISLNSPDAESYQRLCHSAFGEAAYDAIIDFGKECVGKIPKVVFTVVEGTMSDEDIAKCRSAVAHSGALLRIRKFISDNDQNPESK